MSPAAPLTQTILVVEDECLLRMMAAEMFEKAGYRVIEAETGEEGLAALGGDASIAGLFTDIELPGPVDGLLLAATARARDPKAPIMVVSGRKRPSPIELPLDAIFFGKPYNLGRVLQTMNSLLGHKAAAH